MRNLDRRPRPRTGPIVTVAVLACLAGLLAWDRSALGASLHAVAHLRWGWLASALAVQGAAVLLAARGHQRLLRQAGAAVPLRRVLAISTASAALASSVPLAGLQTAAAYSFRQYHRRGVELAVSGWAFTVAWMLSTLALAVLIGVGAAVSGNLLAAAAGVVTAVAFLVPPVGLLLAVRFPGVRRVVHRLVRWLTATSRRLVHRPEADLAALLDAQLARMGQLRLPPRTGATVFGYDLGSWLMDIASLVCAIRATGAAVPWQGLLLAYGAGIAANGLGLTPGGIGVVEAALSAALVASGLPAGQALTAVLAYRLVGFWLPLGVGWVVMAALARRPADPVTDRAVPDPV